MTPRSAPPGRPTDASDRASDPTLGERFGALRRTLEQRLPGDSPKGPLQPGPSPWVSGALAGLQSLIFSLALMVLPVLAMMIAGAVGASPTPWRDGVVVASSVWLLGHGVPFVTGPATLTLVPLGVTAAVLFGGFASARRTMRPHWSALVGGAVSYTLALLFVALFNGAVQTPQLLAASGGGLVLAVLGLGAGVLTRPDAGRLRRGAADLLGRLPVSVRAGLRGGLVAAAFVVLAASVLVVVWLVAGRSTTKDILGALVLDAVSGLSLAVAQLALLPNLVAWGVAWLSGAGFAVGTGTHFGPDGVTSGPLPAVPLLGALPDSSAGGGLLVWAPVVLVLAGVLAGICMHRGLETIVWWHVLVLAATAGAGAGLLSGAVVTVASGAAGPGRLVDVGASGAFVGICVASFVALGALLALVAVRREVWRSVSALVRRESPDTP